MTEASSATGIRKSTRRQFVGCLLGGAVGDALGADIEFSSIDDIRRRFGPLGVVVAPERLAITDDTQMTLFTAEGLIRSHNRWRAHGHADGSAFVHRAYLRWLDTQGVRAVGLLEADRDTWLCRMPEMRQRRAPGNTCLSALGSGKAGTVDAPINDSKGCGGVMRVAPVGLVSRDPFKAGCEAAAITHGHPCGYLSAGFFASVIAGCRKGQQLSTAISRATTRLKRYPRHRGCLAAVQAAVSLAASPDVEVRPEVIERLGGGWVAEEALAITLFCALTARGFSDGVLAAINHSGDSDSTGAMTGNILGVIHGAGAIPPEWLAVLEMREVIETIGDDLYRHFGSQARRFPDDGSRYPAW